MDSTRGSEPIKGDTAKLSFGITHEDLGEIGSIAAEQKISLAVLLRRALSLFRFIVREVRKGNKIFVGKDGPTEEVIFPWSVM